MTSTEGVLVALDEKNVNVVKGWSKEQFADYLEIYRKNRSIVEVMDAFRFYFKLNA